MLLGEALAAATAEDVGHVAAVRAHEAAHVLDDPDDRHVQPAQHRESLGDVRERHVLGRGDEHGATDRHGLGERELRIGGAGRQVHHEVVQLSPLHVAQELRDGAADERAAPHDGLALRDEELDRDRLHSMALEGDDLVGRTRDRLTLDAEHHRDVGTGDVRVQETDRRASPGERNGEVHADRALADAALAGGHGDDVLHARDQLLGGAWGGAPDHGPPGDGDAGDTDGRQGGSHLGLDLVLERAGGRRQLDRERDVGPRDRDVPDHVPGDEVAAELGFLDGAQSGKDGCLGDHGHWLRSRSRAVATQGFASRGPPISYPWPGRSAAGRMNACRRSAGPARAAGRDG